MTGGLVRYLLRSWNVFLASSDLSKGPFFFTSWKKGSARSPNLEMKRPSAVTRPVSFCISPAHVFHCFGLLRVSLDASVRHEETQELARGDSEHTFLWIEP